MLLFFLVFFGLQIFVLFCCAAAEMAPLPRNYLTWNSFSLSQNGKNNIKKRTSAEESFFTVKRIQTGYSHSALLHAHEQNCFAILFSIHMMIHTSPPLLSFTIFFIVS